MPIILAAQAIAGLGLVAFDPFGTWQTGRYDVYNNEWNSKVAGPQTIWANSHSDWGVESNQSNTTEVKVYPRRLVELRR